MSCCCPHSKSGGRIFSFFARSYRRRFSRHGFEPSQQQLVHGLEQAGYKDATLLEVGSGVGYLHQWLLEHGARSATGIDLAPDMLKEAKDWAREKNLSDRTEYIQGDFIELLDHVDPADVTILDKVVCCYPHAELLVNHSTAKTKRIYALTYPRKRWFIKVVIEIMAFFLKLSGSDFRAFVHDPEEIETWILDAGFKKVYQQQTFIWLTQIYTR
ncbi:MAG: methyltransferase domain-containing protein [Gammaproteobacteria bacterium]|nr:methyltransferase domain-containing protein [Gammaproteobacteria bacterium]